MLTNKLRIALAASSIFLASAVYSQETNSAMDVKAEIERNLSGLTSIAQNARGWRVNKVGDAKEYSTIQSNEFVFLRVNPSGLERFGYAGNGKIIWDDNREGFGLSPITDSFVEYPKTDVTYSGTNKTELYRNSSSQNIARANEVYNVLLKHLNEGLDKTPRSKFGFIRRLFGLEE